MRRWFRRQHLGELSLILIVGALLIGVATINYWNSEQASATDEAFPDARVLHIVSTTSMEPHEAGPDGRTETWIDRTSGDVAVREFGQDGQLLSIQIRRGRTLTTYTADTQYLEVREVESADANVLQTVTSHLDAYRWALGRGVAEKIGEERRNGRAVVRLAMARGTPEEATAYVDAETLFPYEVVSGPIKKTFSYPVIETLAESDIPAGSFEINEPVARQETYEELSLDEVRAMADYPVWEMGAATGPYQRTFIERYRTTGNGPHDVDEITIGYEAGRKDLNAGNDISITSRRPLNREELAGLQNARESGVVPMPELITIRGESAELIDDDNGRVRIMLNREEGLIIVFAPTRDLAVSTAETLQRVNVDSAVQ